MPRALHAVVALVLLAGCAAPYLPPADGLRAEAPLADAAKTRVSVEGHRMSEFVAATDPSGRVVVAAMDHDDDAGSVGCATYTSLDGGATWTPDAAVPGLDRAHLRFDPWVTIDTSGRTYLACIDSPTAVPGDTDLLLSVDGAPATLVPSPAGEDGVDKDVILATRGGVLVAVSRAYRAANDARLEGEWGLYAVRSLDGGATWETPRVVDPRGFVPNGLVESPDGALHLLYVQGESYVVATSRDAGETWDVVPLGVLEIAPDHADDRRFVTDTPFFTLPSLAVGPGGERAVAAPAWDEAQGRYALRLHADAGGGWADVEVPAPEGACAACHATHAAVAFDRAGRLGLAFQLTSDGAKTKETWFGVASPGAWTWRTLKLSDAAPAPGADDPRAWNASAGKAEALARALASDPRDGGIVGGAAAAPLIGALQLRWGGEYNGIVALDDGFLALWVDHGDDGVPALWSTVVAG